MVDEVSEQIIAGPVNRKRWFEFLPREDWLVVGWTLGLKLVLFIFGVESWRIYEDKPLPQPEGWLQVWNRWDAPHYLEIAQQGYSATGVSKMFYPLFPWSVRLLAHLDGSFLHAAFIVSGLASVVAVVLLRRLVAQDYPAAVARRATWFFLIFPTAYFFHIGYSESLFLALALGSMLAARRSQWVWAGAVGALCWMTRPVGAALVPALAVEAAQQFWTTRRWNWRWLCIGMVPLGFAVYLWINWKVSGDPFAFVQTRKTLFIQSFSPPWNAIRGAIENLRRAPNQAEIVGRMEFVFAALGFVCTIVSWFKLRPLYAVWMTANWLLITSVSFLQSTPRYTLAMFPIFILFALITRRPFWRGFLTVLSLLYFGLFTILYVRGWWAF